VSIWDDLAATYGSPDLPPGLMGDMLAPLFSPGTPFRSGNPTLDQMMEARNLPDPTQSRSTPPPLGQSMMGLASAVAPYLAGAAPGGSMSAGMRLPGKLPEAAASDLPKPNIGMGSAAPLFPHELATAEVPAAPQFDLPRMEAPPKGIPDYVQRLGEPENLARVDQAVQQGLKEGGALWYHPGPLRYGFGEQLGEQGDAAMLDYLNALGASSNLSKVPENIRNASYYYSLKRQGLDLPADAADIPSPYGHIARDAHLRNNLYLRDNDLLNSQQNPKIASFSQNMMGNYQPFTWDTWISRLYGLQNSKGKPLSSPDQPWYGYLEGLGQEGAQRLDLAPAQYQAAGWSTMVPQAERATLAQQIEDRIRFTAARTGEDPRAVRDRFIRGETRLLTPAPVGLLAQPEPDNMAGGVR
jgi:hypothetical protein